MFSLNHHSFQSQITQSAKLLAEKTHNDDKATLKSIEVVASYYGDNYKILAGLSHFGQMFLAIGQYHIAKWTDKSTFKNTKKISALQKEWAISQQDRKILTKHYAFPEDRRIFLSYLAITKDSKEQQGMMQDWQFNLTSSLFHETGHLIEHLPMITPQNGVWSKALQKMRLSPKNQNDEMQCIVNALEHTIKTLPEEMFADCFAILAAELTGWGDRATIAKETSLWRQQLSHPQPGQEEAELAWMSHYTHPACDLLATRTEIINNTKDAKELAGLVAWQAWDQLQRKMEQKLWIFKSLGLGEGTQTFSDFIARNTQTVGLVQKNMDMEKTAHRSISLKPFKCSLL